MKTHKATRVSDSNRRFLAEGQGSANRYLSQVQLCLDIGEWSSRRRSMVSMAWVATFLFASVSPAQDISEETKSAVAMAESFRSEIVAQSGTCSDEWVSRLEAFYLWGTGTQVKPGNEKVTGRFCREYVLAFLADLFETTPGQSGKTDPSKRVKLDSACAQRLRAFLEKQIPDIYVNLSMFPQRARMFQLLGAVLNSENVNGLNQLRQLLDKNRAKIAAEERVLIEKAIKEIAGRGPRKNS